MLDKLEEARNALGGQVFDVLGRLQFGERPLRELLIEAIRYGELPEVRGRLTQVVANAFDRSQMQDLLEERALWPTTRWMRAASTASARKWNGPRRAGFSLTTSSLSSSRRSDASVALVKQREPTSLRGDPRPRASSQS